MNLPSTGGPGRKAQSSLSSVTGSLGLPAHICRLCGSHNHPFPLTASQPIKEPPSSSSCFWGRSGCLVMILEGGFFWLYSLDFPKEQRPKVHEQEFPMFSDYNNHLRGLFVSESWDPPTSESKSPEEKPRNLNFKHVSFDWQLWEALPWSDGSQPLN